MIYLIGMIVQGIFVIVNGGFILYNYYCYRRYPTFKRTRIVLMILDTLLLIWCAVWLLFDASKVSGGW